jgi:hypothetical protein
MEKFRRVPVERVKEFWDARPCNIRHSPKPVGTRVFPLDASASVSLVRAPFRLAYLRDGNNAVKG